MTDGLPSPPSWPVARGPERWLVRGRTENFDLPCGVPSRPPLRLSDSTALARATIPPERASAHTMRPILSVRGGGTKRLSGWAEPSPGRTRAQLSAIRAHAYPVPVLARPRQVGVWRIQKNDQGRSRREAVAPTEIGIHPVDGAIRFDLDAR